jgi:hypothetical protein
MTVPGERTDAQLAIIEALKDLPDRLEQALEGVPDATLRYRPAEGEWSIKENLGHLRDLSRVWHKRLYMICSLTDPRWPAFDGGEAVRNNPYQDAGVPALIAEIRDIRLQTTDMLSQAVDWTRLGQHPELGRRSLRQWAEFLLAHDEDHIAVIRRLKESQTVARLP